MIGNSFIDLVTDKKTALLAGEQLGDIRIEQGKVYKRCIANGAIAQYQACQVDTSVSSNLGTTMVKTASATVNFEGVYEGATTLAANDYFWLTVGSPACYCSVTGTLSAGAILSPSGTAGALQAAPFTAATAQDARVILLEANASGTANKRVRLRAGL